MPRHRTSTSFRKGDGRQHGRPPGTEAALTAECKDMIATCFEQVGGLPGLVKWVQKSDKNRAFYTRMYIRLMPVNVTVRDHKNVVYESLAEVRAAFAIHGSRRCRRL